MVKKFIPHLLTLGNMACGFLAIRALFIQDVTLAILLVLVAAILDFFDGFAARMLGVSGDLGKQLDSLADAITFGVTPGFMWLYISGYLQTTPNDFMGISLTIGCVLVAAMAVLRLAIFNIDTRQSDGFIGMPTPANTLFVASLLFLFHQAENDFWLTILGTPWVLLLFILVSAFWQVMPIPLFSLKFKSFGWQGNQIRISFLLTSAILLAIWQMAAAPFVILLYLTISIIQTAIRKK